MKLLKYKISLQSLYFNCDVNASEPNNSEKKNGSAVLQHLSKKIYSMNIHES